jgi:hypothetical protein
MSSFEVGSEIAAAAAMAKEAQAKEALENLILQGEVAQDIRGLLTFTAWGLEFTDRWTTALQNSNGLSPYC